MSKTHAHIQKQLKILPIIERRCALAHSERYNSNEELEKMDLQITGRKRGKEE